MEYPVNTIYTVHDTKYFVPLKSWYVQIVLVHA